MEFIQNQNFLIPAPTEKTLHLMKSCGCRDFVKFIDHCIYVMSWMAEAKINGMAVGAFNHDYSTIIKLYSPMLETISAKRVD